jgi:DNA repair exonuclease SbcCD ATPase subunit
LGQCVEENKKKSQALETVTTYLEEVIGRCVLLEEGILSSIESWTDIIPEADVKTQIGVISELTSKVETLEQELSTSLETKGKSEEEIEKLKADRSQKEKELSELRRELSGRTMLTGTVGTLKLGGPFVLQSKKQICVSCWKEYQNPPGVFTLDNQCPECRGKKTLGQ